MKQRLAILGSTGSIGVQTLDIARENPGRFEVRVLTANRNWERLARQAREFDADAAVIADKQHYAQLRDALAGTDTKVYAGEEAVAQVAAGGGTDVVVNALVGYAGLAPTVAAIEAGKKLALANKESLVVGGACVMPLARERKAPVIPIDSEHSAIFQCLVGERAPVRRLIVTCSGGAFRDFRAEELANVTVEQALRHPQWDMGAKITIDSSTLVNKGFEVIEATGCSGPRRNGFRCCSTRSRSSIRWSNSRTARSRPSSERPTCACRSASRCCTPTGRTVPASGSTS